MIQEMHRCVAFAPPHVKIRKWRLTYAQANDLAHELHGLRGPVGGLAFQSPADILMTIVDGNQTMFNIPVEVKFSQGQAYPLSNPRKDTGIWGFILP